MKIEALRIRQGKWTLYVTTLPARWLADVGAKGNVDVDVLKEAGKPETDPEKLLKMGYQRLPSKSHYQKLKSYFDLYKEDAILPTSIILNSRNPSSLLFNPADDSSEHGFLVLKKESLPLMIVDGQHRILGLKYMLENAGKSTISDVRMPVTIIEGLSKVLEVSQFYTINTAAKKVPVDLADRLLNAVGRKEPRIFERLKASNRKWRIDALHIIDLVTAERSSIWHGKVRFSNSPPSKDHIASQGMLVNSIKVLVQHLKIDNRQDEQIAQFINDSWFALKTILPEAFKEPKKYVIQRTSGVWPIHLVLPYIHSECVRKGEFGVDYIARVFERDQEHFGDVSYWEAMNLNGAALFTSQGSFRLLKSAILDAMGFEE